jgi:hypothetical protein
MVRAGTAQRSATDGGARQRARSRFGRVIGGSLTLTVILGLAACGGDDGDPAGPDMTRIAYARAYQNGKFTVPKESSASIGEALARLEPTWVTGLIRLRIKDTLSDGEVSDYDEIRKAVRAKSPNAEFDVELNALDYLTPEDVEDKMREVREAVDNDGWFFDFFTPAYDKRPEVVRAAISAAHDNGEWIGGNTFGWSKDPGNAVVPPDSDFLAIADSNFRLDLPAARKLAKHLPIVYHLRNNPGKPDSDGCVWINRYTTSEREAYMRKRAREQKRGDFHFAYPVFFPTCLASRHAAHDIDSFNVIRDGTMLGTIAKLMQKYNSGSS